MLHVGRNKVLIKRCLAAYIVTFTLDDTGISSHTRPGSVHIPHSGLVFFIQCGHVLQQLVR